MMDCDYINRDKPTIIKGVKESGRVDVRSPYQDIVYGPLSSLQAGGGEARRNGKWLPPAQTSSIGQSSLWEDDIISPH